MEVHHPVELGDAVHVEKGICGIKEITVTIDSGFPEQVRIDLYMVDPNFLPPPRITFSLSHDYRDYYVDNLVSTVPGAYRGVGVLIRHRP